MKKQRFNISVVNNIPTFTGGVEQFTEAVSSLKDGEYSLTLEKKSKIRSLNQNKYYRGVVIPLIADHIGFSNEETHDALKDKFLPIEKITEFDLNKFTSTTALNTVEFEKYLSDVRQWASEFLSVYIPLPNEPDLDLYFQNL